MRTGGTGTEDATAVRNVVSSLGVAGVRDAILGRVFTADTDWDEVKRIGKLYGVDVPDDPGQRTLWFDNRGARTEAMTGIMNSVAQRIFDTVSRSDSEATKLLQVLSTFFRDDDGNVFSPSELKRHLFVQA